MPALDLKSNQRVGAIGRTRCGKTYVMERVLAKFPRVIVIDSKHRVNWKGYAQTKNPVGALAEDKVIYRHEGDIPNSLWEDIFAAGQDEGGIVVYIDELGEVTTPNKMPSGLTTLFRLGGELGIGVYWSAQEATSIANTAIRQSDVLLLFLNIGASDRDKLNKITGDMSEVSAHLNMYEFVVFESGGRAYDPNNLPVYMAEETISYSEAG